MCFNELCFTPKGHQGYHQDSQRYFGKLLINWTLNHVEKEILINEIITIFILKTFFLKFCLLRNFITMNMQNALHNLNWLAIVVAAISAFVLGGLWYSPLMFVKRWMKETGITEEDTKNTNMIKLFSFAFILSFIASFFLAMFIGPKAGIGFGALAGFMAGFGWVFTFMGISYLFESRTLAHFLINSVYSIVSLTIMGAIIGVWQ